MYRQYSNKVTLIVACVDSFSVGFKRLLCAVLAFLAARRLFWSQILISHKAKNSSSAREKPWERPSFILSHIRFIQNNLAYKDAEHLRQK